MVIKPILKESINVTFFLYVNSIRSDFTEHLDTSTCNLLRRGSMDERSYTLFSGSKSKNTHLSDPGLQNG